MKVKVSKIKQIKVKIIQCKKLVFVKLFFYDIMPLIFVCLLNSDFIHGVVLSGMKSNQFWRDCLLGTLGFGSLQRKDIVLVFCIDDSNRRISTFETLHNYFLIST